MEYSREWSEENFDRLATELVEAVEEYGSREREAPQKATRHAYYRILGISRSMSMHLGNMLQLDYQEEVRKR